MIEKILDEIELILEDKHKLNSLDFSYYLEEYLIEHYDKMYQENSLVTELLNEELLLETNKSSIHYSKHGVHLVPSLREFRELKK